MEIKLFNSLENKISEIELSSNKVINIYLCGPTVYDHIHIGNLRSVIIFDVLHRLLLSLNIKVNYVQNITDIDDKIIDRAEKEKKDEKKISRHYTKAYFNNLVNYNILFPSHSPRVTNYLPQIKSFINSLLEKGHAYEKEGEILFHIGENKEYGKLSGQNLEKLKTVRNIIQSTKRNEKDFIIWKKSEKGIMWNSPWGKGRPGWHSECVVFIKEFFKNQTIDIHGGGNDLLFPHHENERIQYLANNNSELSKLWFHISHLNWGKEKMSKSLGNVFLAKHFYQKYGTNVLRYIVLNTHHNQVINFNENLIQQSLDYNYKIIIFLKKLNFYLYTEKIKIKKGENIMTKQIITTLLNNLNTVKVFYFLDGIINFINKSIDCKNNDQEFQEKVNNFFFIIQILGFKFDLSSYNLSTKLLIKNWQTLRKNNDYIQADKIRKELKNKGII